MKALDEITFQSAISQIGEIRKKSQNILKVL